MDTSAPKKAADSAGAKKAAPAAVDDIFGDLLTPTKAASPAKKPPAPKAKAAATKKCVPPTLDIRFSVLTTCQIRPSPTEDIFASPSSGAAKKATPTKKATPAARVKAAAAAEPAKGSADDIFGSETVSTSSSKKVATKELATLTKKETPEPALEPVPTKVTSVESKGKPGSDEMFGDGLFGSTTTKKPVSEPPSLFDTGTSGGKKESPASIGLFDDPLPASAPAPSSTQAKPEGLSAEIGTHFREARLEKAHQFSFSYVIPLSAKPIPQVTGRTTEVAPLKTQSLSEKMKMLEESAKDKVSHSFPCIHFLALN